MWTKEKANKILEKLKQDPLFELKQELGNLLRIHKNDFTEKQLNRYNELILILKSND